MKGTSVVASFVLAGALLLIGSGTATGLERPAILGEWQGTPSSVGNPNVLVTRRGSGAIGRATDTDGCVRKGRPIWRIDSASGGFAYGALEFFYVGSCDSAGFGAASWTIPIGSDAGQLCAFPPSGGSQTCAGISRAGSPVPLPPTFGIDRTVLRCITVTTWFHPEQYCTQVYHAPSAGRWDTRVYYCNNPVGVSCPKDLRVCALYPGQPCVQYSRAIPGVVPPGRAKPKKPRLATIAQGSFDFTDPGEGESSIDLAPTTRATKRLTKLGRKRKTVQGYIVSSFTPASGEVTASTEGVKIKLPR